MPAKPIKRGVKLWMLCDANNAYLSKFDVYLGKQNNTTEHGLGHNVVMKLSEEMHHSHRHVYFDNYFTGVPLLRSLLEKGLYACGTIRQNRKEFPRELHKPRDVKQRGDSKTLQKGTSNLTATVWKDKRLVYTLSTLSDPAVIVDAQRRVGSAIVPIHQPQSVCQYNKYMGGVDLHDQMRMKYDVGRNGKKWWKYLFWFLVNCCAVNAYIVYRSVSRRTTSRKRFRQLDFRMELVRDLVAGFTKRKRPASEPTYVGLVHQENVHGHVHGKLPGPKRRCRYHLKQLQQRRETVYGCTVCNVHLCKDGCHSRFHNL